MDSKKSIKSKIIAHLDGEISSKELQGLFHWINKSKENLRYYTELKDIWEASVSNASEIAGTAQEWKKFLSNIDHKAKIRRFSNKLVLNLWYKVAAVLVFAILVGSAIIKFTSRPEPVYLTATAPRGSISQILLPDSTLIYLNAGTEIKYNIGENQKRREVNLNGEAWFQVTTVKNKPFVVHTSSYDVKVLGTEFNVKAYETDSRVETTLEKGSVMISPTEASNMFKMVELSPSEQFVYDKNVKSLKVRKVNTKQYSAWKDNKLIFINMSLEELIVVLERKYGVDIEVENNTILKYHYYGTIMNETIIEILEILMKTLPISYRIADQKIEIIDN
jgi:ferric-dicitrate binding protein FerR (iron transport regulator)